MTSSSGKFENNLLHGNITRNIFNLALPIITAHLFANIFYIVDMIYVGRIGPTALAAVSMGAVLMSLVWTMLIGLAIGASSLTARYYGSRNMEMVEKIAHHSMLLTLIVSLFLFVFGLFGTPLLLRLLGGSPEVVELGTVYTRIVFSGAAGLLFMFIINSIFRGCGDVKTPMIIIGITSLINIILDPLLIFGIGPFPELGVKGAAIATVIGQGIGAILNIIILFKGYSRVKLSRLFFKPEAKLLKTIIGISLPGSLQNFYHTLSGLILMRLVSTFGTPAIAAYGIGIRLDIMVMLPGWAIGAAVATIVGQNLGANQPERAEKTAWQGAGMYFVLLFAVCTAMWFGSSNVISLFNNDPFVVDIGNNYIRIVAIGYVFLSLSLILTMAMNGAGYTFVPMLLIAISYFLFRVPIAFILSKYLGMNTNGIWIAVSGSFILQAALVVTWFRLGYWKYKKVD